MPGSIAGAGHARRGSVARTDYVGFMDSHSNDAVSGFATDIKQLFGNITASPWKKRLTFGPLTTCALMLLTSWNV